VEVQIIMKPVITLLLGCFALSLAIQAGANEIRSVKIGNAEVVYEFAITETDTAILTLNALVNETNNSLRRLKNTDPRRPSELGQLIYQCKLMLYKPVNASDPVRESDPALISKNFSLYSGANIILAANERMGIRVQALLEVDDASLFTASLGIREPQMRLWETTGEGEVVDLRQFAVNILQESDVIATSESLDITVRFPVFQLEKPAREWIYNFDVTDFKQAVRHIDEHCTPESLVDLIKQNG
jgi:hypothetical protein